jgi:hypothetical protein
MKIIDRKDILVDREFNKRHLSLSAIYEQYSRTTQTNFRLINFNTLIMYRLCLLALISMLFVVKGFSQSEIKIYGGVADYPGISFENYLKKNLSVEISTSFRSEKTNFDWEGSPSGNRDNNLFINGFLKKYHTNKKGKTNFYYGAYIRYWQQYNYRINVDQLTIAQQAIVDNNRVNYSTKTNKISYGFLTGYKLPVGQKFTLGINTGIGFSLPFTYWKKEVIYNQPTVVDLVGDADWIGYWNHLSLIGQLSFGYRFGISKE